jgi:acetoacetyl-CoA synthetase
MMMTSATEVLLPIWRRVLQESAIRANDNFFDLGGNPSSAARLFREIAEVCGRDLPPVMIYSAPTIEALAALLEQPSPPRVPPLLLLKAGTGQPPIFIAHGLGDTVFSLFHLVDKIESTHPIYGMQSRGIDGVDDPFTSIEAMAQFHLDTIKKLQPHGPYFLIGYSLGGLVTLEIAQRLSADGERVALLALVDSYPDKSHLSVLQHVLLSLRLAKRRAGALIGAPGRTRPQIPEESGGNSTTRRMRDSAYLALRRYRPQFYRGGIKFVKAEINTYFPDNPIAVWSHLAEKFEVETIPGDHLDLLTTQFEKLGSVLSRYLEKASS